MLRSCRYDSFGNRTDRLEGEKHTRYTYNALNQLVYDTDGTAEHHYEYDGRGNLIRTLENGNLAHAYAFGAMNRMNRAVDSMGNVAEYLYNGLGHRTGMREGKAEPAGSGGVADFKENGFLPDRPDAGRGQDSGVDGLLPDIPETWNKETEYILDFTKGYHNLLQREEDGNIQSYVWDSGALFMEEGEENYSYLNDLSGSVMRLSGNGRDSAAAYRYDEFGTDLSGNQGKFQPFGYTGYQRDAVAGTYYAQAREYDAGSGRFTSEDVVKGSAAYPETLNAYGYCWGNPVMFVDRDGRESQYTKDGRAAHQALQEYFLKECAQTGQEGYKEYTIDGCQYDGTLYKNTTGKGRADIILIDGNTAEVYEIKPYLGTEQGKQQLEAYIQGINKTTHYQGVKGTIFNPNGLILDYPGNPKKEIWYKTDYNLRGGIIQYNIRNKKDQERPRIEVWGRKFNDNSKNKNEESGGRKPEEQDEDIAAIVGLIFVLVFCVADDAFGVVADDAIAASALMALVAIISDKIDKLFKKEDECAS